MDSILVVAFIWSVTCIAWAFYLLLEHRGVSIGILAFCIIASNVCP
jgi:hypothetical protein